MKSKWIILPLVLMLVSTACSSLTPATAPTTTAPTAAPAATTAPQNASPAAPTAAPAATTAAASGNIRFVLVAGSNEARYRVREQLAGVNLPSDAIGATKTISGAIVTKADGSIVKDQSNITIDISKLQSDRNQRDNFLRTNVLQTNRFPNVIFVPTEAQGLAWPIKDGAIEFKLIGDMTVRDVTKPITWNVKLTVTGNEAKGQATTNFKFAFFNIDPPRVPTVLSIEDDIKLEIDLHLKRE